MLTEAKAWENDALHLAHCGLCANSAVHCASGQAARNECFEGEFVPPTRDPALRKAALDADRALARWQGSSTNADYDAFCMAMDALREELAK
jgi:hypothetical protein